MKATVTMNFEKRGVEICTDTEHFVISAMPSVVLNWDDACRFEQGQDGWSLPTKEQLVLIARNIKEVNKLMDEHGGYRLFGWHWSNQEKDEAASWLVFLEDGVMAFSTKDAIRYVRYCCNLN